MSYTPVPTQSSPPSSAATTSLLSSTPQPALTSFVNLNAPPVPATVPSTAPPTALALPPQIQPQHSQMLSGRMSPVPEVLKSGSSMQGSQAQTQPPLSKPQAQGQAQPSYAAIQSQLLPLPHPADPPKFWHVEYYSKYFDIDTSELLRRLRLSLYPNPKFLATVASRRDLYGPFWVPTTLALALFVASSFREMIHAFLNRASYRYDIRRLGVAFSTVFVYSTAMPLLGFLYCKYISKSVPLHELLCVFGYGVAIWIPVSMLCIVDVAFLRWVIVIAAAILSSTTLLRNIGLMLAISPSSPTAVLGIRRQIPMLFCLCAQISFALALKIIFYA